VVAVLFRQAVRGFPRLLDGFRSVPLLLFHQLKKEEAI
jgi:hypothetical protein